MSYHQPKAFTTEQGSEEKENRLRKNERFFTDGFLFFTESRLSLISRILPHTAHGISLSFIRFTIAPISVVISPGRRCHLDSWSDSMRFARYLHISGNQHKPYVAEY